MLTAVLNNNKNWKQLNFLSVVALFNTCFCIHTMEWIVAAMYMQMKRFQKPLGGKMTCKSK